MPKKTLERNKSGGWDKKTEALPSEVEQKKQGLAKPKADDSKSTKQIKASK